LVNRHIIKKAIKHTEERNKNLSKKLKGHKVSDKTKEAVSKTGKISSIKLNSTYITCPHCKKIGKLGPMKRWHCDNCKFK